MKIPLSNRLLACCDFVHSGDRVADVGCDHGYLGIYLLKNEIASSVIESDINEMPLESAKANAAKFGTLGKTTFCLSNGVQNIPRDFDTLVCAGMGADTIISILEDAPWLQTSRYRLILQCQSKRPELRQWLSQNGYRIHRETLAKDGKFVYAIMEVVYDPGHPLTLAQTYLSPALLSSGHPLLEEYSSRVLGNLRVTVEGLKRSGGEGLSHFENILHQLEEMLHGNG